MNITDRELSNAPISMLLPCTNFCIKVKTIPFEYNAKKSIAYCCPGENAGIADEVPLPNNEQSSVIAHVPVNAAAAYTIVIVDAALNNDGADSHLP